MSLRGLEPPRINSLEPKPSASTNSATATYNLDTDLMVTLSAEGGVSCLYPSKHLAGVQMLVEGIEPTYIRL